MDPAVKVSRYSWSSDSNAEMKIIVRHMTFAQTKVLTLLSDRGFSKLYCQSEHAE